MFDLSRRVTRSPAVSKAKSAESLDFNCLACVMNARSEGAPQMNSYLLPCLLHALCTGY